VYAVGHSALTRKAWELAAVLSCGREALLSHRAAGARRKLLRGTPLIEVTVPRGARHRPGFTVHESRVIHPDDRGEVDGIPTTSVVRTIVDLAETLDDRRLAAVVNEAEVQRVFDLNRLEATMARLNGRRGSARLHEVLAAYKEPPGYSTTEAERLLHSLCKDHGLPQPGRIFAAGCEVDFFWPDVNLAIEVDGRAFHATRRAFDEDRQRDRRLAAAGIQVARLTWRDLQDSVALAAELKRIRRARRLDTRPPVAERSA
jgi:hypothetical protein